MVDFRPFFCCTLAGNATQRLVLQVAVLIQCQVVKITTAVMVDNLVEKVDECSLNQGC